MSHYFWETLTSGAEPETQEAKAELVKHAAPLLRQITLAPTLSYLLRQELSEKTGIDPNNLAQLMGQTAPQRHVAAKSYQLPRESYRQPAPATLLQQQLRTLLFNAEWAEYVSFPDYLDISDELACLLDLAKLYRQRPLTAAQALEHFRQSPHFAILDSVFAHAAEADSINDNGAEKLQEFQDGMRKIVQKAQTEHINRLRQKPQLSPDEKKLLISLLTMK